MNKITDYRKDVDENQSKFDDRHCETICKQLICSN